MLSGFADRFMEKVDPELMIYGYQFAGYNKIETIFVRYDLDTY